MTDNTTTNNERISVEIEEDNNQRLFWLSVIMQGLSDALSSSQNQPFKKRREEAIKWFQAAEGKNSDLAMVCNYADVDFRQTQKRAQMFLNGEIPAVDFRCLRKGYDLKPESQKRKSYFRRLRRQDELKILNRNHFNDYSNSHEDIRGLAN